MEEIERLNKIIALRKTILDGWTEMCDYTSAKATHSKCMELLPVVKELGEFVDIENYYDNFIKSMNNELAKVLDFETIVETQPKDKKLQKQLQKDIDEVVNHIAYDIRHLGFGDEEEELSIVSQQGYNPISNKIIGLLFDIQHAGSPERCYAITKTVQQLLAEHSNDQTKTIEQVGEILKNEMSDYYKTKHENQRAVLVERLNAVIMPAL